MSSLLPLLPSSEIGNALPLQTPYGQRPTTYADYTASARSLKFMEEYICDEILPYYGNTHTVTSKTGRQTSDYVDESRQSIKNALACNKSDRVFFTGTGATGAVNKLVALLGLETVINKKGTTESENGPLIIVGPYEHHSNILPYRESTAVVLTIPEDASLGGPCLTALEAILQQNTHRDLIVGAFNAASNVTGLITDVSAITVLLHKYNAYAVFDYAAAAPSACNFLMNDEGVEKDGMFFSPHKLPGGPQSVGVLVVKKWIARYRNVGRKGRGQSSAPGGGTVFYVDATHHVYVKDDEEREEGGTGNIVGCIRAGLVVGLMEKVGAKVIHQLEESIVAQVMSELTDTPNLVVLGRSGRRLPVFSCVIRVGKLLLHHNFVTQVLNDLFGVQCRGGCMCAGPYSQRLLGIDERLSEEFLKELTKMEDNEILRPGYFRFSLPYYATAETVAFVVDAVKFVAMHGWKLLPQYTVDVKSGEFKHANEPKRERRWLGGIDYTADGMLYNKTAKSPMVRDGSIMKEAMAHVRVAEGEMKRNNGNDVKEVVQESARPLRWFVTPGEAAERFRGIESKLVAPFEPVGAGGGTATGGQLPLPRAITPATDGRGWVVPPKKLVNKVMRAVLQHGMVRPGDKILLGLSGGKDSLTLLHVLHELQRRTPFEWSLGACTVDPQADGFDPSSLKKYLAELGCPYFYESVGIMDMAEDSMSKGSNRNSICSYCSRMKRTVLYFAARREGYNVLAMAQHLDDQAESFMMSALHNGCLRAMKAHYGVDEGDLRVIRPLVYVRETEVEKFAEENGLPIVTENCPACFEAPKERYRVKCLLATQEALFPDMFQTLLKTIVPLMEPKVEDFLRGRREEYGNLGGVMCVPAVLGSLGARKGVGNKGRDPFEMWRASLRVGKGRVGKGGRGCSAEEEEEEEEEEDELVSWFGKEIKGKALIEAKTRVKEVEGVVMAIEGLGGWEVALKEAGRTVVFFGGQWCKGCKEVEGSVAALAKEVRVCKVDVDENEDVADLVGVVGVPCFGVWCEGKAVGEGLVLGGGEEQMERVKAMARGDVQ